MGEFYYGGEPFFFVMKEGGVLEDDGYLLSSVHDEKKGELRLLVMDGKSTELEVMRVSGGCLQIG